MHNIDALKKQFDNPKDRPHIQHQLKELQSIQLWRLNREEKG
jgi:hypothetical protein